MGALDEARQRPGFGLVMAEAVWVAAQRARAVEAKLAAIDAALTAAAPPLGIELRPDGTEDREADAYVQGVGVATAAVRAVLGEQPAGVLLTPDEAKRAIDAVVRGGFRTDNPADEALADRLEEVALRA